MKKTIVAMLPVFASAKFKIDKPDNWDKMTDNEKKEYFEEHMESDGDLCHQCSDSIESDFEYDPEFYKKEKAENLVQYSFIEKERYGSS